MALGTASGVAAQPPAITAKQQQAVAIQNEIYQMDSRLEKAIEAWNAATIRLKGLERELKVNTHDLGVARSNLGFAQRSLEHRLVALYQQGDQTPTLGIFLGSASLDDFITRMDTQDRLSDQDATLLRQVRSFRNEVRTRQAFLRHARSQQSQLVSLRMEQKRSIESQLASRERYLASVKDEIAQLQAEEAARQLQLQREAEARLQQQYALSQSRYTTDAGIPVPDPTASPLTQPPPVRYSGVVGVAMSYLGVPYVWGGASPGGFDCSGLTSFAYAQMGVSLPHNAAAQFGYGTPVSESELQPGDLVFFDGLGHVGLYIGGGQFIHAPHTGDVVKISSLSEAWYAASFVGARRIT